MSTRASGFLTVLFLGLAAYFYLSIAVSYPDTAPAEVAAEQAVVTLLKVLGGASLLCASFFAVALVYAVVVRGDAADGDDEAAPTP